ncbi:endonuclease/exonuclease/phosphatase family protein [Actinomadura sp. HBU206391]|uniref:endonuclease/exonuclease/phosphatase family protein n=1 Tax=Actinomadura sp. HBU206391 TaxID=2731692 RepID=UPI00164FB2C2|nr:endonuclease/exonuclease/phosphatase family protein [Actinomadura sp. HBU206391]MBC6462938.1 endonuclease/exonuclease/phosphatase family protein [Actinomadura sp. HBU206391]
MDTIRALTFNTLFRGQTRARLRVLGELLERSDYDVVCLQEVMSPLNLALLRKVTKSYDHVAHGARLPLVRGGLVILSRWPIAERRFAPFRRHGPVRGEWLMRKGALIARVQIEGRSLTVMNTHLSANMSDDWSPTSTFTQVQTAELKELASAVTAVGPQDPLLVMGDFNVPRDSWLFDEFVSATGLRDVMAGDTEPTYRPTPQYSDTKALDQVLVRAPTSEPLTVGARLVFQEEVRLADGQAAFLSDHYGISAEISA